MFLLMRMCCIYRKKSLIPNTLSMYIHTFPTQLDLHIEDKLLVIIPIHHDQKYRTQKYNKIPTNVFLPLHCYNIFDTL